jgi:hypothetical protein
MLGDGHAGSGANNRSRRGNVDCSKAVAAGADDIQDFAGAGLRVERRLDGFVAQRAGERGDFFNCLALFCERGQKIGFDIRRNFFIGELLDGLADFLVRQRTRVGELACELFEHARSLSVGGRGSN